MEASDQPQDPAPGQHATRASTTADRDAGFATERGPCTHCCCKGQLRSPVRRHLACSSHFTVTI